MKTHFTKEEELELEKMLSSMKDKDPMFDLRVEYGRLLMKHINDFTPAEKQRYDELENLLKLNP